MHKQWLAALEENSSAEQLRAEFLMLSQSKFEAETALWLFTRIDREQRGWRREVVGSPPIRKRVVHNGWMVIEPMKCDIDAYGLSAALTDAMRLAEYWNDFELFRRGIESEGNSDSLFQPDLFFGQPRGINAADQLDDGVNFLFSQSLR